MKRAISFNLLVVWSICVVAANAISAATEAVYVDATMSLADLNGRALKPGCEVLFKRGGVWRGTVVARPGVTYAAYGCGEMPRIYGSPEDGANPARWRRTDNPRVWAYAIGHRDVGTLVFDGGAQHAIKIICRTDPKTGRRTNMTTEEAKVAGTCGRVRLVGLAGRCNA